MERTLLSGFSSECLPDKVGLNSSIIIALRATFRHLDRMYTRTMASASTVVWPLSGLLTGHLNSNTLLLHNQLALWFKEIEK
jgi:hypothetical protein